MLLRKTGDYPAAIAREEQALALFRRLGDRLGQTWALDVLGRLQHLTGDYPAALATLTQALELLRAAPRGTARSWLSTASASWPPRPGRSARPATTTTRRSAWPGRSARRAPRRPGPWPGWAAACCPAVRLRPPITCAAPWRSAPAHRIPGRPGGPGPAGPARRLGAGRSPAARASQPCSAVSVLDDGHVVRGRFYRASVQQVGYVQQGLPPPARPATPAAWPTWPSWATWAARLVPAGRTWPAPSGSPARSWCQSSVLASCVIR